MKRMILTGAALFSLAVTLAAVPAEDAGPGGGQVEKSGKWRFEKLDSNKDGFVDKSEFKGPKEAFQNIDSDSDGKLTEDEMRKHHESMIKEFDKDGNGELSEEEKEAMRKEMAERHISEKFKKEDKNGDGFLDQSEFKGPPQVFQKIDENADGKLSKEELQKNHPGKMMKKGQDGTQGGEGKGKKGGKSTPPSDLPAVMNE